MKIHPSNLALICAAMAGTMMESSTVMRRFNETVRRMMNRFVERLPVTRLMREHAQRREQADETERTLVSRQHEIARAVHVMEWLERRPTWKRPQDESIEGNGL